MAKKLDLRGYRFGRLVVTAEAAPLRDGPHLHTRWACRCDCGNDFIARTALMRAGKQSSCGCARPHLADLTGHRFGRLVAVERLSVSAYRCTCDCGADKLLTVADLKVTRSCGCSRRGRVLRGSMSTHLVCGREMTVSEMAKVAGISDTAVRKRLASGMSPDDAVKPPTSRWGSALSTTKGAGHANKRTHEVNGELLTFEQAAALAGVTVSALRSRITRGMSMEQAVTAGATAANTTVELFGGIVTINELVVLSGRDRVTLMRKLSNGVSVEEAAFGKFRHHK